MPADLLIRLDARLRVGLQQQIYNAIRRSILDGIVTPGARLPSSRALAIDLRVSRTTTLLAYEQLVAEGYLTAQHGSGTFVARELPEDLPRLAVPRRPPQTRHPPLARRGLALATIPPCARRIGGPPRPFRLGVPALDLFPVRLWSQLAGRRLRNITLAQLDYGDAAGWAPLRKAIAHHVETMRGTRCVAEQVIITAGAQRGIEAMCQLLLDEGDTVWLEEPAYPGARRALMAAGARIVPVRVDDQGLDVAAGARLAPNARLAFITPSHQFPLGVHTSLARRLALLRWASAARAWIVEDDYDSEFRYGTRPIPCLHGLDRDGRVIYVGSFSKSLFPALRLGFVIVPPDLQPKLVEARRSADLHPPVIDQAVLADFIESGHYDRHLHRMRAAYRERLEALSEALGRTCAGALTLRPVRTGLHAVADLIDVDADRVVEEAAARGVEVSPLSQYYANRQKAENGIIVGFAPVRRDAIRSGAEQLAEAIEAARRPRTAQPVSRLRARG
jgi:GntR family transcriptional regulator/MocR family aminotransferase